MTKKKYTAIQIRECIHYLAYGVKEGYIEPEIADEILENSDWDAVYQMMHKAEAMADAYEEENGQN